jgi:hypothetical protein
LRHVVPGQTVLGSYVQNMHVPTGNGQYSSNDAPLRNLILATGSLPRYAVLFQTLTDRWSGM